MSEETNIERMLKAGREAEKNPIGTVNGRDVYTVKQANDIAVKNQILKNSLSPEDRLKDAPQIKKNPDGSYAGTRVDKPVVCALDIEMKNRYRKVLGQGSVVKEYHVVTDWRAVSDYESGQIYAKHINAYVVKQNKEKELYIDRIIIISDEEFINEFKSSFAPSEMFKLIDARNKFDMNVVATGGTDKLEF